MYKRKRKKKSEESMIQKQIIYALRLHRCDVYRVNVGLLCTPDGRKIRTGVPNGFPDLFGYRWDNHKIFFIEVKKPKGYKISPAQLAFHQDFMHHKTIHGIAKSVDDALKIVDKELIGYGYPDTNKKEWL